MISASRGTYTVLRARITLLYAKKKTKITKSLILRSCFKFLHRAQPVGNTLFFFSHEKCLKVGLLYESQRFEKCSSAFKFPYFRAVHHLCGSAKTKRANAYASAAHEEKRCSNRSSLYFILVVPSFVEVRSFTHHQYYRDQYVYICFAS